MFDDETSIDTEVTEDDLNEEFDDTEFEDEDDWEDDESDWEDEEEDVDDSDEDEENADNDGEGKPSGKKTTIKYNGKEIQLTEEELIAAAQKGYNYDHIKGELDSVKTGNVYKAMKAGADKAGMSVEKYAEYLLESGTADAQLKAEKELKEKYPTAPADMIKEMARMQVAKDTESTKAATETEEQKAWSEALAAYPDLDIKNIPEDVQKEVAEGTSPLLAMKNHEIREIREQLKKSKAEAKRTENRSHTTGSVTSHHGDGTRNSFMDIYNRDD